jgi:hypothetical protein
MFIILTIFSMSCISICLEIKEWFIFSLGVVCLLCCLYFVFHVETEKWVDVGLGLLYTCTGKKNSVFTCPPTHSP